MNVYVKSHKWWFIGIGIALVLACFGLTWFMNKKAPVNPEPPVAVATVSPTPFKPAVNTPAATAEPLVATAQPIVVVVTATGVSDLGQLLGNQPMTPIAGVLIDWDHLKLFLKWEEAKGLTEKKVLYFQTGVPNSAPIPQLKAGDQMFTVPTGVVLIYGAYKASITLGDGTTYEFEKGFYNALPEGTIIKKLSLTDGFALLIEAQYAQDEYCKRVAQAMSETPPWAHENLYRPAFWGDDPICEGVYTTPNDSDR